MGNSSSTMPEDRKQPGVKAEHTTELGMLMPSGSRQIKYQDPDHDADDCYCLMMMMMMMIRVRKRIGTESRHAKFAITTQYSAIIISINTKAMTTSVDTLLAPAPAPAAAAAAAAAAPAAPRTSTSTSGTDSGSHQQRYHHRHHIGHDD